MRGTIILALTAIAIGGRGGDDSSSQSASAPATTASTATAAPTTPTETTPAGGAAGAAKAPAVTLSSPRNGDQILEGSDARAKFKCRNAKSCEATVASQGGSPQPVKDGGALPTKPGNYTFEVVATADGQTAKAVAIYGVPDVPGNGGD